MTDQTNQAKDHSLDSLTFINDFAQLPSLLHRSVIPTALADPTLVSVNHKLCEQLEIDPSTIDEETLTQWLSGQGTPPNCQPLAMKYTGHQFGHYNPELGDGRGLLLGEQQLSNGRLIDWHLKGAGRTPFSRFGDGRAVLRSTIREYLVGEALHHLNIPSTRALGIICSSEQAQREELEPCASLIRISPCHIRFGHFEYLYYNRSWTELQELADYVITRYFAQHPACAAQQDNLTSDIPYIRYRALLACVITVSAKMVAGWQTYGFLHGVMNTDNMSIIGETFDHGPFAFIDRFDWQAVYNHTDSGGRYAFGRQPDIMLWNLSCLAQALLPLLTRDSEAGELSDIDRKEIEELLNQFKPQCHQHWYNGVARRLGINRQQVNKVAELDQLIDRWHTLLDQHKVDFQRLYRDITAAVAYQSAGEPTDQTLTIDWQQLTHWQSKDWSDELEDWLQHYVQFCTNVDACYPDHEVNQHKAVMQENNPIYLLRSHITQAIIEAAQQQDYSLLNQWLQRLQQPFKADDDANDDALFAPESATPVSLSCSS